MTAGSCSRTSTNRRGVFSTRRAGFDSRWSRGRFAIESTLCGCFALFEYHPASHTVDRVFIMRRATVWSQGGMLLLLSACGHLLEDNGTHLAYELEEGAAKLRASDKSDLTVSYETLDGDHDPYYIEITPSFSRTDLEYPGQLPRRVRQE